MDTGQLPAIAIALTVFSFGTAFSVLGYQLLTACGSCLLPPPPRILRKIWVSGLFAGPVYVRPPRSLLRGGRVPAAG